MADRDLIETVRAGGRVSNEMTMHACYKDVGQHECRWRTVVCDSGETDRDVVECSRCGDQRVVACNFDEEYS